MVNDGLIFRKNEGHVGEISQENGSIIDSYIFFIAHDILDDLSDNFQRKESFVELCDFVVSFEVGSNLFDNFANIC